MTLLEDVGAHAISVKSFKCFGDEGGSIGILRPINIIIGRNNSGKSALVDVIRLISTSGKSYDASRHARGGSPPRFEVSAVVTEDVLRRHFPEGTSGGEISFAHNHWEYGKTLVGAKVAITYNEKLDPVEMRGLDLPRLRTQAVATYQAAILGNMKFPIVKPDLLEVAAERDVRPEASSNSPELAPNGTGLTNMIRAFINRDNLPREEVEVELLHELNEVYRGDSVFSRISCRENESGEWEIFVEESGKGSIRLSQSGSSLKSVFIILCQLRLTPIVTKIDFRKTFFVVEEPENNLHPSLLRRLLQFLANAQKRLGFVLLVATHSPIAIDWAARRDDSAILHVAQRMGQSFVKSVDGYLEQRDILDDLDIRASDILQANGVVWVEGPSDRIYLRRWLDLASGGELVEGVHYTIMFYGGRLLSHLSALPPGEQDGFVSTLSINRNVALIMDSDRHRGKSATASAGARRPRMRLNDTKERIRAEIDAARGLAWVTEGREIENYLSPRVLEVLTGKAGVEMDLYADIPEHHLLGAFKKDKISLANAAVDQTNIDDLDHLDLRLRLAELVTAIRMWNTM